MRVGVLTVSDKGAAGERSDASGPAICNIMKGVNADIALCEIVPDERGQISKKITEYADSLLLDLVITTGGTGVSPRDVTPEATRDIIDKEVPGFAEAMRMESMKITPHAIISRGIAGIRNKTLIINLPGSPKAAAENLQAVLPAIPHALAKIQGDPSDCAQN